MKTLYLSDTSSNIVVDTEENTVGTLPTVDRYDIRSIYYVEDPMHVVYQSGETKEEIDAKKGDVLIMFYNNDYNKNILTTVKSKQWSNNIKNRIKLEQKEREAWAARKAQSDLCGCDCAECKCSCCDTDIPEADPKPATKKTKKSKK